MPQQSKAGAWDSSPALLAAVPDAGLESRAPATIELLRMRDLSEWFTSFSCQDGQSCAENPCPSVFIRGCWLHRPRLEQRLLEVAGVLWQREKETGAMSNVAFRPDPAAVALHDVFDDGQSQAGAALLA